MRVLETIVRGALAAALAAGLSMTAVGQDGPTTKEVAVVDDSAPAPASDGHRAMVAQLALAAERTDEHNKWLGTALVMTLRERAEQKLASMRPAQRIQLLRRLGREELRIGNYDRSVAAHTRALVIAEAPRNGQSDELRHDCAYELGVASLRMGETENCVECNCCESCLFPLVATAQHTNRRGSEGALTAFRRALELEPDDVNAIWLMNIAAMTLGQYPDAIPPEQRVDLAQFASDVPFPRFDNSSDVAGVNTFNLCGGACFDDFDNDGDIDLVTGDFDPRGRLAFFRNRGDGTFTDESTRSRLGDLAAGLNLVQADYDNDGLVDILVFRGAWLDDEGRFHPNSLIRNLGDGRFEDVTIAAGLADVNAACLSGSWADFDNDGDLDLYCGNESGREFGVANQLFRNNGDGTFTDVAPAAGVDCDKHTKGVTWGDYDGDGDQDLYVSNLSHHNLLYRNEGDGTFVDVAEQVGVQGPIISFPTWFWDYDNDGVLDLYVGRYSLDLELVAREYLGHEVKSERAACYHGSGTGTFEDRAHELGVDRISSPMGANFADIDSDGWLDFYLGTGFPGYEGLMPNLLYLNQRGQSFADVTTAARVGHLQKGHAVAFGDVDNDGDVDLFAQLGGAFQGDGFANALFMNPGTGNRSMALQLIGTESNRSAIGARIRVEVAEPDGTLRTIHSHVTSGGSFGANPLRQTIGLGRADRATSVEVHWPTSGVTQRFEDLPAGHLVRITEGTDTLEIIAYESLGR